MLRVRPIRLPQLGHKCFEVRLSPSMVKDSDFRADHAVMAVTVDRDFWQGRHPAGGTILTTYLANSADRESCPDVNLPRPQRMLSQLRLMPDRELGPCPA
jgi:hypothetical protein